LQTGTIAGNLAMKHEHNEFPSDMYLMLETVGATLNIGEFNYHTLLMVILPFFKNE
jgi:xanthine dehydrogenase/oxidase